MLTRQTCTDPEFDSQTGFLATLPKSTLIVRTLILLGCAVFVAPGPAVARDVVEVQFNTEVREYCHVVRFPSGWHMPDVVSRKDGSPYLPPKFSLDYDFEFRVSGLLGTRFLVRGVEKIVNNYYTSNLYEIDLSDPRGVAQQASEEAWNSAAVVAQRYTGPAEVLAKYIQSLGFRFVASGAHGAVDRLSPDRAVLVLQSWSGTLGPSGGSDVPGDFSISLKFGRAHGKLFFDVYSTDTGKKLITLTASFVTILPEEVFAKTGWITERYFFIPLDERRERCLVCEFGRK